MLSVVKPPKEKACVKAVTFEVYRVWRMYGHMDHPPDFEAYLETRTKLRHQPDSLELVPMPMSVGISSNSAGTVWSDPVSNASDSVDLTPTTSVSPPPPMDN